MSLPRRFARVVPLLVCAALVWVLASCGNSTAGPGPSAPGNADTTAGAADAGTVADSATPAEPVAAGKLPPDPVVATFDVDACAVLVAAAGEPAVAAALKDAIASRDSLMNTCSMSTKEYRINDAGSTSTGRLSFGVSPTSLAAVADPKGATVEELADSRQGKNAIVWRRGAYWFSLQVLPVQKSATDPDVIDPAVLTALARAVNDNA